MKAVILLAVIALTSGTIARQTVAPQLAPADVRAKIEAVIAAGRAPSMVVAVARDDRIVWSDGFGFADKRTRTPATAATPYAVGSLTKTFTATALMALGERGRIALDDPIAKHLGANARPNVTASSEVTIRRTLQHVGGFPVHAQWFYLDRPPRPSPFAESLGCYGAEISTPGERYVQSNLGYGVLGEVVTRAAGEPYETFLAREIFQPLGLRSAKVVRRAEDAVGAATPHGTDGEPVPFFVSDHPAASDLYIDVEDLVRFGLFHAGGLQPSRRIIEDTSRLAMQEPGIGGYGFGWLVNNGWHGRRVVFNSGARPGASAALWIVPAERIAVALVANQIAAPVNQLAGEILELLLGIQPSPAAIPAEPTPAGSSAPRPALPAPGPELRGQWRGTMTSCPRALDFSLDIRDTHDLVGRLGNAASQAAASGAASRGEASGTLEGDAEMGPSTFEFDVSLKDDRLEGPVIRRTSLGPRGNVTVTMWAVLTRARPGQQ